MPLSPAINAETRIAFVLDIPSMDALFHDNLWASAGGHELGRMCQQAGLPFSSACHFLAVQTSNPPSPRLLGTAKGTEHVLLEAKKVDAPPGSIQFKPKFHITPAMQADFARLRDDLLALRPNLVLTLGDLALRAVHPGGRLSYLRGTVCFSPELPGIKILPTYSPDLIIKAWDLRVVMVSDLIKASHEYLSPETNFPIHEIWVRPTIDDIRLFKSSFIDTLSPEEFLTLDIETAAEKVTCIGFSVPPCARSMWRRRALVIPFFSYEHPEHSYWRTPSEEVEVWRIVQSILEGPQPKLTQNGLYDIQFLWSKMNIRVLNSREDTMHLHHARYLELEKSLGFMGSIYTNNPAWKKLHKVKAKDVADEER